MIVGITGYKGSGKSSVTKALVDAFGFERGSFAAPMKRFVGELFGWSGERLNGPSHFRELPDPKWDGLTARRALQTLGTEWGRSCHPDVWVRYAIRRGRGTNTIFDDVRFPNEALAILAAGGLVFYVDRPAVVPSRWRRYLSKALRVVGLPGLASRVLHESEAGVDEVANLPGVVWLPNTGTVGELESLARSRLSRARATLSG